MALDPRIILAGQTPNFANALMQGSQAAQQTNQVQDQNALRGLYAQQGAGIAQGDPQALNALAGLDPKAALGVQESRLGMDNTRHAMDIRQQTADRLSREEQRAVEARAASLSAAEAAAEAQQIEDAVKQGLMIQTPEQWDQMAQEKAPHLVGQFANREALAAKYMSVADILKQKAAPEDPATIQALRIRAQESGLQPGTPEYQAFMANAGPAKNGITVTSPDGTEMTIGGSAATGGGVGKPGQNVMDAREIDSRDSLARLDRIEANFTENPELFDSLGMKGSLEAWGLKWADFISGGDLTKEQADKLVAVTQMRGDVLENLNYTIKAITGAAMTEPEAKRIGATLPGIKDGPTVFKAKMERALESTRMAVARYNYWRNNGLEGDPTDIGTLSDMDDIIQKRADELHKEELSKGGEPTQAWNSAKARLSEEFGL